MYNSLILLKYWYNLQQAGRRTYASVVKSSRTTQQQAGEQLMFIQTSNSHLKSGAVMVVILW
jgi:hypothetical protein